MEALLSSPAPGHEGQCQVCYSALDYAAIAPCGHNDICGVCHLRLRYLHNDKKCPMCKSTNEQLVVDRPGKLFEEYPLWGNELGADFVYRDQVGMFFPNDYYAQQIEHLFAYHCTHCNDYDGTTPDPNIYEEGNKKKKPPTPLQALQDHLRHKHRLALCQLCVDFKRDFVSQLPRFTPSELKTHLAKGDGIKGHHHPMCEFCAPKRFYDLALLHQHLQREHYKCDLCDRQGRPNQYFRNYQSLQHHFDAQHYLCKNPQCLSARFVVFDNEIDLRAHQVHTHGSRGNDTKIQLEFRVRREGFDGSGQDVPRQEDFQYTLDGQAFVPEELPSAIPNESTSHPLHLERTNELRAQAAQIRQTLEEQVESFPSLSDAASGGRAAPPLNVGWTSGSSRLLAASKVGNTQEHFPSLPSSSSTRRTSAAPAKLKSTSSNRQFTAMRHAAAAPTWGGAATAAPSQPVFNQESDLQRDNFPSLGGISHNRESDLAVEHFPSLGGGSSTRYVAAENLARKTAPPSLTSTTDFPPPPSASSSKSVRERMLGERKQPALSKKVLDNVLEFPPPRSNGTVTIEEIKATLGTTRYKQLRSLTKEFAADALAPDAYVDHVAMLFDAGYADHDLWSFLPSLLDSCPNESSAREAKRYMDQLRLNQLSGMASNANATSMGGWSTTKPSVAAATAATPAAASSWPAIGATAAAAQPIRPMGVATPALGRSAASTPVKTHKAWGGESSSSVMRAKAKPGTVSMAAAQQEPQRGTATKFMAKESKQEKLTGAKSGPKSSKKKQNDELRALAFGGK